MRPKGNGYRVIAFAIMALLISPILLTDDTEGRSRRPEYWIDGYVTDSEGAPVEGAVVRVIAMENWSWIHDFTNETGYYSFYLDELSYIALEVEKDGYLKYRNTGIMLSVGTNEVNVTLSDLPEETVDVQGHVSFLQGGEDAPDVRVILEYMAFSEYDYYSYEGYTDGEGDFSFTIFPGVFSMVLTYRDFTVYEEVGSFDPESAPYEYDIGIPMIPELNVTVKGYVTDGVHGLEEVMVVLSDQMLEVQQYVMVNDTGYFEIDFWGGMHVLFTMSNDHDFHFERITVPDSGVLWYNITLALRQYEVTGTVIDPEGTPLEGVEVNFIQSRVFPDQNSVHTDQDGSYRMIVSDVPGYLLVTGEDPFEGWDYDTYFEELTVEGDLVKDIRLNEPVVNTVRTTIDFDGWEIFDASGVMGIGLNTTRYMRLFIDLMIGDGDRVLTQAEFDEFYSMMMEDDSDMGSAPFGLNTTGNITLDGLFYDRSSNNVDFMNLTGSVDLMVPMEVHIGGGYILNGTLPISDHHTLIINMTYDDPSEETRGLANVPEGWLLYEHTSDQVAVTVTGEGIELAPGQDPDPMDDVYGEFVILEFFRDQLSLLLSSNSTIYEGIGTEFTAEITDTLPENEYEFTWDFGETLMVTATPRATHTFPENGEYRVTLTVTDAIGRNLTREVDITVLNMAPEASLQAEATSAHEGELVNITLSASDVPTDPLMVSWSLDGVFTSWSDLTPENSTYAFILPDDGDQTVHVAVSDDDGGMTYRNMTIFGTNVAPVISVNLSGTTFYEGSPVRFSVEAMDVPSDVLMVSWSINGTFTEWVNLTDTEISYIPADDGSMTLYVAVRDDDGGIAYENRTIAVENVAPILRATPVYPLTGDRIMERGTLLVRIDEATDPADPVTLSLNAPGAGITVTKTDEGYTVEFAEAGTFYVMLTADDGDGGTKVLNWTVVVDVDKNLDHDGDGIPMRWEELYGLSDSDPSDADLDPDGDGKTNWEEYQDGTDPTVSDKKDESEKNGWVWIVIILIIVAVLVVIAFLVIQNRRAESVEKDWSDEE